MPWSPSRDGTQWSPVAISVCSLSSCIVNPVRVPARERIAFMFSRGGMHFRLGKGGWLSAASQAAPSKHALYAQTVSLPCQRGFKTTPFQLGVPLSPSGWKFLSCLWSLSYGVPFSPLCPLAPKWDSFLRSVSHFSGGREDWPPANTVTSVKFHFSKHFPSPCSDLVPN